MTHPMEVPPRELSPEEREQRGREMFALQGEMIDALQTGRGAMWTFAAAAHRFDEEAGWSALGYDTATEWLAQPELGISRTHFYRLVRVFRELRLYEIGRSDLLLLEPTKVDIVLPAVRRDEVPLDHALDDVRTLSKHDLQMKYYGSRPDPAGQVDDASLDPGPTIEGHESGGVPFGVDAVGVLRRVWEQVAPPEKKHMSNALRQELRRVLDRADAEGVG